MMSIRVLAVDDHELVRCGLRSLFHGTEIEMCAEAGSGEEGVLKAFQVCPDIVVMDVKMPGCDGLTALERIRAEKPNLPILMFSVSDNATLVAKAIQLGANGFLAKTESGDRLIEFIRRIASGATVWSSDVLRRVACVKRTDRVLNIDIPLTSREGEVLTQVAQGRTNKDIAIELRISYETVKEHVANILRKLGVSDRTQAAVWAVRQGVV